MLKPIEASCISKTNDPRGNNDGVVINGNYIAVIDAYQARGWRGWANRPAGIFAKDVVAATLENQLGDQEMASVITALEEALQAETAKCMEGMEDKNVYAYPMTRVLIYSIAKRQIWRLGDSPFVVDGELNYTRPELMEKAAQKRSDVLQRFVDNPKSDLKDLVNNDYGRSAAMDMIVEEERRVDGVEALSGRADVDIEALLSNVEVFQLDIDQEVILASDGYPRILPTLDESEDWLKDERARDPLFIHDYKALRGASDDETGYDDRTYIRFITE